MNATVYLDHNATSPLQSLAKQRMVEVMDMEGNPSSVHTVGRQARRVVEEAREQMRQVINGPRNASLVFTSSGTEANTLALMGSNADRILVSAGEHASIMGINKALEHVVIDKNGLVDLDRLQTLLADKKGNALVSVMLANNETGAVQDLKTIVKLAHNVGALVHTDAVQALGKIKVDFSDLGVDMMSLSAHKTGGPLGVGALIVDANVKMNPINRGGGQESGLRGGTENIPAIAAFAVAAQHATADIGRMERVKILRDELEQEILKIAPQAQIMAQAVDRLPNTSFVTMPNVTSETQVMAFDLAGVCVSAGSACGSGKTKSSSVLSAMGVADDVAKTAVRVSFGPDSTKADMESFVSVYKDLYQRKAHNLNAA